MRSRAACAFLAVLALALSQPASAADRLAEQRARVKEVEARIAGLSARMSTLIADLGATNREVESASGSVGISQIRLAEAQKRAAAARRQLNARAADAYKKGAWRQAHMLLGVKTYTQILSFRSYFGNTMNDDAAAVQRYEQAALSLRDQRLTVDQEKAALLSAERRLYDLRVQIQDALNREQSLLSSSRAELAALEAVRKRDSGLAVSPVVAARRAARQQELDRKLSALLAWYAPGSGSEPYMPGNLKGTGVVTHGLATWYGPGFDSRRASSGATYRQTQLTAASLVLPFGTLLKVTYKGRSVIVVITDRGPYVAGRVLDLSMAASQAIGHSGVKEVRMEVVIPKTPAPPFP